LLCPGATSPLEPNPVTKGLLWGGGGAGQFPPPDFPLIIMNCPNFHNFLSNFWEFQDFFTFGNNSIKKKERGGGKRKPLILLLPLDESRRIPLLVTAGHPPHLDLFSKDTFYTNEYIYIMGII